MVPEGRCMSPFFAGHSGTPILNTIMIYSAEYLVYLIPLALIDMWFSTTDTEAGSAFKMALLSGWFDLKEGKSTAIFIFVTVVVSLGVSYLLSQVYSHPAPYMRGYETLVVESPENSFPSQHTTVMFAFAWPFFYLKRYRIGIGMLGLATLVGISRVYVGVHYPIDIVGAIASSLIGFAMIYIVRDFVMEFAAYCIRLEEQLRMTLTRLL